MTQTVARGPLLRAGGRHRVAAEGGAVAPRITKESLRMCPTHRGGEPRNDAPPCHLWWLWRIRRGGAPWRASSHVSLRRNHHLGYNGTGLLSFFLLAVWARLGAAAV